MNLLARLGYLLKMLWLCGYATAFIIGAVLFFVVSARGLIFCVSCRRSHPSLSGPGRARRFM
jgi:hypothetical protein